MFRNYLLWLVFGILLLTASATACLAGQDSNHSESQKSVCCLPHEEGQLVETKENTNNLPVGKESKQEETKEISPSILNSNFIFYIIYKFKFVDNKGSQYSNETEEEEEKSIPVLSYIRTIYSAINSLLEKKF